MTTIEQIVSKYLDKVARRVAEEAKVHCPVDTGALRASIESQKNGDLSFYVGAGLSYGLWQEIGTRYITPRAYLRRAVYNRNNYKA